MSMENAKKFVSMVMEDEALQERTAKMKPEEVLAVAKEGGLDFTADELTEVMNADTQLDADDLTEVSGGANRGAQIGREMAKRRWCHGDPKGPEHDFVKVGHREDSFFFFWTKGYDVYECKLCGYQKEVHV